MENVSFVYSTENSEYRTDSIFIFEFPFLDYSQKESISKDFYDTAFISDYRLETRHGVRYFVLQLNVYDEFFVEKYFCIWHGSNDKLLEILKKCEAISLYDECLDYEELIGNEVFIHYHICEDKVKILGFEMGDVIF